jgi:hypothetical protein
MPSVTGQTGSTPIVNNVQVSATVQVATLSFQDVGAGNVSADHFLYPRGGSNDLTVQVPALISSSSSQAANIAALQQKTSDITYSQALDQTTITGSLDVSGALTGTSITALNNSLSLARTITDQFSLANSQLTLTPNTTLNASTIGIPKGSASRSAELLWGASYNVGSSTYVRAINGGGSLYPGERRKATRTAVT